VAWAEVYFRTKRRLHPSSHLATIDMGQKLGGLVWPFSGGSLVNIERNVASAEAYLRTKWHLDASSWLATINGPKIWGGLCSVVERGAVFPFSTMWTGPRPTCMPSAILIHPAAWPQYKCSCATLVGGGGLGPHITQSPGRRPTFVPSGIFIHPAV